MAISSSSSPGRTVVRVVALGPAGGRQCRATRAGSLPAALLITANSAIASVKSATGRAGRQGLPGIQGFPPRPGRRARGSARRYGSACGTNLCHAGGRR